MFGEESLFIHEIFSVGINSVHTKFDMQAREIFYYRSSGVHSSIGQSHFFCVLVRDANSHDTLVCSGM